MRSEEHEEWQLLIVAPAHKTLARTHKCWLLITGRILFGSVVSVNIQWLVLQRSSSVDQMCHIARWERFCLSGNANKVWQTIGFAICPVLACHFHEPVYVTQWHLPCGKTGRVATLFWGFFFSPPSSCHTYAENNVLLWPIQCNLWSCQLEQGYCGTLIACQLLRLQCVCSSLGLHTPVGLRSRWHLSTFPLG